MLPYNNSAAQEGLNLIKLSTYREPLGGGSRPNLRMGVDLERPNPGGDSVRPVGQGVGAGKPAQCR